MILGSIGGFVADMVQLLAFQKVNSELRPAWIKSWFFVTRNVRNVSEESNIQVGRGDRAGQ